MSTSDDGFSNISKKVLKIATLNLFFEEISGSYNSLIFWKIVTHNHIVCRLSFFDLFLKLRNCSEMANF